MAMNSPSVEASFPVDFRLRNQQGQSVLYTRLPSQSLQLALTNTSRGEITIPAAPADPGTANSDVRKKWCTDNHCIYLAFRPGTLFTPDKLTLDAATKGPWQLVRDVWRGNDLDGYFLIPTSAITIDPQKNIQLPLQEIQADGSGGSRSTRVELKYQKLQIAGSDHPLSGHQLNYLAIMDELPSQVAGDVPILVEWVGSNTLLNDSQHQSTLTLRLANQAGRPLKLNADSKISIHFPMADDANTCGILMAGDGGVTIKPPPLWRIYPPSQLKQTSELKSVALQYEFDGPTVSLDLPPLHFISFDLTLKSSAPNGTGWVQVMYSGIDGLSATVQLPILKTPLVIPTGQDNAASHFVGIGTATAKIHLAIGDDGTGLNHEGNGELEIYTNGLPRVRIDTNGNVGIGTAAPAPSVKLDVSGTLRAFAGASNDITVETTGDTNSWAKLNLKSRNQEWALGTSQNFRGDQFYLQDNKTGDFKMTVQPGEGTVSFPTGNVGIGTVRPNRAKLQVAVDDARNTVACFGSKGISLLHNGPNIGFNAYFDSVWKVMSLNDPGTKTNAAVISLDETNGQLDFAFGSALAPDDSVQMKTTLSVLSDGNVGIGTAFPKARLVIKGDNKKWRDLSIWLENTAQYGQKFSISNAGIGTDSCFRVANESLGADCFRTGVNYIQLGDWTLAADDTTFRFSYQDKAIAHFSYDGRDRLRVQGKDKQYLYFNDTGDLAVAKPQ